MRAKAKSTTSATRAIGVRITAGQFAWLDRQAGTPSSVIRRLLDREVARGTAGGRGNVSRAELLEVAAQITDLADRVAVAPVVEDAAETEDRQSPAPAPEAVAPVVGVAAAPMAVEPPAPVAELEPAPDLLSSLPSLAPVAEVVESVEPEVGPHLSVVEVWLMDGWPVRTARGHLKSLDYSQLPPVELDRVLVQLGKSRSEFTVRLDRLVAEWLEASGQPAPDDEDHATEARLAYAAELRAALMDPEVG